MKTIKTRLCITLLAIFFAFGLSACATLEGVGKDLEAAGEAIQESAEKN